MIKKSNSDLYAERDGIEIVMVPHEYLNRIVKRYKMHCAKCGDEFLIGVYDPEKIYFCEYHKRDLKKKKAIIEKEKLEEIFGVETKEEKRFQNAIDEIKGQVKNFNSYEKAIGLAKQRLDKYASIPEAMVAIELLYLGYRIIPQQKITRYNVDFALPDEKLIIEVDGQVYHKSTARHDVREAAIQLAMGIDWKILHVPAELIRNDIKKMKKIIETFK